MDYDTRELKELLIQTLMLERPGPASISDDDLLFGGGLDLDSVDVLELALALKREYGIEIKAEDENNKNIFRSVGSLAAFIAERRI